MEKKFEIKELIGLVPVANFIKELSQEYSHFCLEAPMGAGKTTLIKEFCRVMGVIEHTSSPTYSIVNEYETESGNSIFHFDLYRLRSETELLDIGILEILDSGNLCFFEWPEKIHTYLDEKFVNLTIEVVDTTRIITLTY
jgi:tRNA threonylcarbamoyladenosine biosynthesis protein TsaE